MTHHLTDAERTQGVAPAASTSEIEYHVALDTVRTVDEDPDTGRGELAQYQSEKERQHGAV